MVKTQTCDEESSGGRAVAVLVDDRRVDVGRQRGAGSEPATFYRPGNRRLGFGASSADTFQEVFPAKDQSFEWLLLLHSIL